MRGRALPGEIDRRQQTKKDEQKMKKDEPGMKKDEPGMKKDEQKSKSGPSRSAFPARDIAAPNRQMAKKFPRGLSRSSWTPKRHPRAQSAQAKIMPLANQIPSSPPKIRRRIRPGSSLFVSQL